MTQIHLARAPAEYDPLDQNIMRKAIENAILATQDSTSSNMGDIVVNNPENGQVLIYSDGSWINHTLVLDNLDDVVVPSPTSGHYLYYNGTNWVDRQIVTDDIEVKYENVSSHTLSQLIDEQLSAGWDFGGQITVTSATTITVAAGGGFFTDTDSIPNDLYYVEWPEYTGISVTTPGALGVGMKWDGPGTTPYVVIRSTQSWNHLTEWTIGTVVVSAGDGIEIKFDDPNLIRQGVNNSIWRIEETNNFERANRTGVTIGETDNGVNYRYITMSAGYIWATLRRQYCEAVNTLTDLEGIYFAWFVSGSGLKLEEDQRQWATYDDWDGGVTPTDSQWLYNDGTDPVDPLKQIPANQWGVFWFIITEEGYPIAGFHNTYYSNEASAEQAPLPPWFSEQADQLISKFVFRQGQNTAQSIFTLWDLPSGAAGAAVTNHGDLSGLSSDDHFQYLHLDISRDVTAQHTFSVYGTGDWLSDEWDILIGDTVTNDGGAINVGGAGYSMAGNMGSIGTPGITLDGAVISSNRGAGPDGNIEFGWTDSLDEIRFALAKSGAGFGTYNPRSMIIAGPAVADDDIVTGSYWGFDNLPMDTSTFGADCGVQHDLEVLGKMWIDIIGTSTTDGSLTFDDDVIFTETVTFQDNLTLTGANNVYLSIEATDVDSLAWLALQNDAREYRLRVTGANEFDIYDVTAAATRFTLATSGIITVRNDFLIAGSYGIHNTVTTGIIHLAGGDSQTDGGNIRVYGSTHSTNANNILMRQGTTEILKWDSVAGEWQSTQAFDLGNVDCNVIRTADGNQTTPAHSFTSATGYGMYYSSSQLRWSIASDLRMYLSATVFGPWDAGGLDLGTTTVPWNDLYCADIFASNADFTSSANGIVIGTTYGRIYFETGATHRAFKIAAQDTVSDALQFFIATDNTTPARSATYEERMRITNTSILATVPHVVYASSGDAYIKLTAVTDNAVIYLDSNGDDAGGEQSMVYFRDGSATTSKWRIGKDTDNSFRLYDYTASQNVFIVNADGGMTLSPNGDIFFNPDGLDVVSQCQFTIDTNENDHLRLEGSADPYISWHDTAGTTRIGYFQIREAATATLRTEVAYDLALGCNSQTALTLKSSGNVQVNIGDLIIGTDPGGSESFRIGGSRPITADGSTGSITTTGSSGGWAMALKVKSYLDTDFGGFGFYGSGDTFSYYWIGDNYNTESVRVYQHGVTATLGTGMYLGRDGVSHGDLRIFGATTGTTQGGRILIYASNDYDTNNNHYRVEVVGEDFYIRDDGSVSLLYHDFSNKEWVFPNTKIKIDYDTSSDQDAPFEVIGVHSSSSGAEKWAVYVQPNFSVADTGTPFAGKFDARTSAGSGTRNRLYGLSGGVSSTGAGTVTDAACITTRAFLTSGTWTNLYHILVASQDAGGTVTNCYGIYIPDMTHGTNNWSIYSAGGTVEILGDGIVVGAATGGDKGAGTINVSGDIYKNNTAYTSPDYVFEHYYGQSRVSDDDYDGLMPLPKVEKYLMEHMHLPRITRAQMGIFQRADTLLEKVEEVFLYLIEHERKLDELLETIKQ